MVRSVFSKELEDWLFSKDKKTLESLEAVFRERSFAIIVLVLMAFPALPLPTGGITHIFELAVMLIAVEMMAGWRAVWLPKKWRQRELGPTFQGKFVPYLIRRIRWFERFSRPRFADVLQHPNFSRLAGLLFFILALAAFMGPPFSGLDTLPAMGAVMIALSIILGDFIIFAAGGVIGALGVGLIFAFGAVTINLFKHFL
jgi:hypothetical protein